MEILSTSVCYYNISERKARKSQSDKQVNSEKMKRARQTEREINGGKKERITPPVKD